MYRKIIGMCLYFACMQTANAQKYTLYWDKEPTTYYLHLPKGYDKLKKYPLIVNFHGMNSTAIKQQDYCEMDNVADKEGFITVYPQSIHQGWMGV